MDYEKMRNSYMMKLNGIISKERMELVLMLLDDVAQDYDVRTKCTELTTDVVWEELPEPAKIYLVVRKTEGLAEKTLQQYHDKLKLFFRILKKPLHNITANDIRVAFYEYQKLHNASNRTLDTFRACIIPFFKWCHAEGYIDKDPTLNIKPIKYQRETREPLTHLQMEYVRQHCINAREKALVEFIYSTGCRISEVVNVKLSDIDFDNKKLSVVGKGNKKRTVFLNAKAIVALKEYMATRDDEYDCLFVSEYSPHKPLKSKEALERTIKRISDRAKCDTGVDFTPHHLRHTVATHMLDSNVRIEYISQILGHSSLSTTMIYAKINPKDAETAYRKAIC